MVLLFGTIKYCYFALYGGIILQGVLVLSGTLLCYYLALYSTNIWALYGTVLFALHGIMVLLYGILAQYSGIIFQACWYYLALYSAIIWALYSIVVFWHNKVVLFSTIWWYYLGFV